MWTGSVSRVQRKYWPETGSALSPLLFIATMELINRKKEILRKLLYADELTIVADGEPDLQKTAPLVERSGQQTCLRVSLEKMEVMCVGQRRKVLKIHMDGK